MADKKLIVHGMDLNEIPVDDTYAIVPVQPKPLVVVPPKPLATIPPTPKPSSYESAYFMKTHEFLPPPPERLLLDDIPKGPIVAVPPGTMILPPKKGEVLTSVKTKNGRITCATYSSRPTFNGVHAERPKIRFIPPKEALERALAPAKKKQKHSRPTVVMLHEQIKTLTKTVQTLERNQQADSRKLVLETDIRKAVEKRVDRIDNELHELKK